MHRTITRFQTIGVTLLTLSTAILIACGGTDVAAINPPALTAMPSSTATAQPISTPSPEPVVVAAPSLTPSPSATALPTITPNAAPIVTVETPATASTSADALAQRAFGILIEITNKISPRASASEQERVAAVYIAALLSDMGYNTTIQDFEIEIIPPEADVLRITAPESAVFTGSPMHLSGTGTVAGEIAYIGKGFADEFPPEGVKGKLALAERGTLSFQDKADRAAEAGANGLIVFNNEDGLFRGRLSLEASIPVVGVSRETGQTLLEMMQTSGVEATLTVEAETLQSRNVIAGMPGTDPNAGGVVLGGHFDTVPDVAGANDNGSGIAALLTVAEHASVEQYPFGLRFIAFGAEEIGLHGSRHYVGSLSETERQEIIAMLNFDALGSGTGSEIITSMPEYDELSGRAEANGLAIVRRFDLVGATSDHAVFDEAGIPYAFFMAGDFSRIHTTEDKLEHVQPELLGAAASHGMEMLEILAGR